MFKWYHLRSSAEQEQKVEPLSASGNLCLTLRHTQHWASLPLACAHLPAHCPSSPAPSARTNPPQGARYTSEHGTGLGRTPAPGTFELAGIFSRGLDGTSGTAGHTQLPLWMESSQRAKHKYV